MWLIVKVDASPLLTYILNMLLDIFTTGINSATKDAKTVRSLFQEISIQRLDVNAVVTYSDYDVEWPTREKERNSLLTIPNYHVLFVASNSKNTIISIINQIIKRIKSIGLVRWFKGSTYVQDAILEQKL
jgi:hypothetical protein